MKKFSSTASSSVKVCLLGKSRSPVMRLLLIEDEPELLRTLAAALREEGFAVDTAAEGEDGLAKALAADYDAMVLDVMIPKLNGWDVLRRLRERKRTPVLMLT